MTDPPVFLRTNWFEHPALIIDPLRDWYTVIESVLGRANRVQSLVKRADPEDFEELKIQQKHLEFEVARDVQKLKQYTQNLKRVSAHTSFPKAFLDLNVLTNLSEKLKLWCVQKSAASMEECWQCLFKLDKLIVTLAVNAKNDADWSSERTPEKWRTLLEGVGLANSTSQWRKYRKDFHDQMKGTRKAVRISRALSERWRLQLPEFGDPETQPLPTNT